MEEQDGSADGASGCTLCRDRTADGMDADFIRWTAAAIAFREEDERETGYEIVTAWSVMRMQCAVCAYRTMWPDIYQWVYYLLASANLDSFRNRGPKRYNTKGIGVCVVAQHDAVRLEKESHQTEHDAAE